MQLHKGEERPEPHENWKNFEVCGSKTIAKVERVRRVVSETEWIGEMLEQWKLNEIGIQEKKVGGECQRRSLEKSEWMNWMCGEGA